MTRHEGDFIPRGPLTEEERIATRVLLRDWSRGRWIVRQARNWILYLGVLGGGYLWLKDQIVMFFTGKGG